MIVCSAPITAFATLEGEDDRMNELIWVGNTLYPRWIVFLVLGLIAIGMAGLLAYMTPSKDKFER